MRRAASCCRPMIRRRRSPACGFSCSATSRGRSPRSAIPCTTARAGERLHAGDRETLAELQKGRDWLWIAGNHDPAAAAGPRRRGPCRNPLRRRDLAPRASPRRDRRRDRRPSASGGARRLAARLVAAALFRRRWRALRHAGFRRLCGRTRSAAMRLLRRCFPGAPSSPMCSAAIGSMRSGRGAAAAIESGGSPRGGSVGRVRRSASPAAGPGCR